jgi:hypothetical protein
VNAREREEAALIGQRHRDLETAQAERYGAFLQLASNVVWRR